MNIIAILIIAAFLVTSCNSQNNGERATGQTHEHVDGDGHDHENEPGHDHSKEDGHDHAGESTEKGHSDEIGFTREQAEAAGLETEIVKPSSFSSVIQTSGQIQALQGDEQTIVATSSGILFFTNASITEGTSVKNGESVASISAKNLQDGDPVLKAKLAFETAEKEFRRAEKLVADKIISAKEFEQTRMRYETARAAYEGQANNFTAKGVSVTSPIAGYIKSRLAGSGEYVSVGQPIAVVAQNRRLQLRADVSENYFKQLRNIQSANFKTAYDDVVYRLSDLNGRLLSYGKTATGGASYIPVTFEFDNIGDIVPGSFTDVYLLFGVRENVLSVPVSALTEEQGLQFVYLQIEDEIFRKQEVTPGQSDGTRVEILKGLKIGDKVVTKGTYQVKLATASTAIPGHNH